MATNKSNIAPAGASIRMCKLHLETIAAHPEAVQKLNDFMTAKVANPTARLIKDSPFIAAGPIGKLGLNMFHAHLTQDLAICYRIHSRPTLIDLYGIFSHAELGTGNAAKIRTQQQIASRFDKQKFD